MDESITITRGSCDTEAPSAALAASSRPPVVETDVTLNASGSTDNDAISAYRWDRDGDGTIETVTDDPTLRTTFDRSGTYDARVTVVDRANNTRMPPSRSRSKPRLRRPLPLPPRRRPGGRPPIATSGASREATVAFSRRCRRIRPSSTVRVCSDWWSSRLRSVGSRSPWFDGSPIVRTVAGPFDADRRNPERIRRSREYSNRPFPAAFGDERAS